MSGPQGSYLVCRCGSYEPVTGTLRQQREAHRAHRVEMGETVQALLPTPRERAEAEVERLTAELVEIRGHVETLERYHREDARQLDEMRGEIVRLRGDLAARPPRAAVLREAAAHAEVTARHAAEVGHGEGAAVAAGIARRLRAWADEAVTERGEDRG